MSKLPLAVSTCLLLNSCVGIRKYQTLQMISTQCAVRDSLHLVELDYRKRENAALVAKTNTLSEDLGQQKAWAEQRQRDLEDLRKQAGSTTAQLVAENRELKNKWAARGDSLQRLQQALAQYTASEQARRALLQAFRDRCTSAYTNNADVAVSLTAETLEITFGERALFEQNGVLVNGPGKTNLGTLATLLNEQPTLQLEIQAHTDNIVPSKDKIAWRDTWGWSLERATNVVRTLVRDLNVNANQLIPIGRGEFTPLTSNETSEGRLKNRRTVLVLRPLPSAIPNEGEK